LSDFYYSFSIVNLDLAKKSTSTKPPVAQATNSTPTPDSAHPVAEQIIPIVNTNNTPIAQSPPEQPVNDEEAQMVARGK
jgi:hypothetical protein